MLGLPPDQQQLMTDLPQAVNTLQSLVNSPDDLFCELIAYIIGSAFKKSVRIGNIVKIKQYSALYFFFFK